MTPLSSRLFRTGWIMQARRCTEPPCAGVHGLNIHISRGWLSITRREGLRNCAPRHSWRWHVSGGLRPGASCDLPYPTTYSHSSDILGIITIHFLAPRRWERSEITWQSSHNNLYTCSFFIVILLLFFIIIYGGDVLRAHGLWVDS